MERGRVVFFSWLLHHRTKLDYSRNRHCEPVNLYLSLGRKKNAALNPHLSDGAFVFYQLDKHQSHISCATASAVTIREFPSDPNTLLSIRVSEPHTGQFCAFTIKSSLRAETGLFQGNDGNGVKWLVHGCSFSWINPSLDGVGAYCIGTRHR